MSNKNKFNWILPVLFSFFIMSFVDLVGIGVDRATTDFNLSSTMAQLIPMVAFLWFFVLSVPIGVLQSKIGKRKILNAGMLITAIGLLFPFFFYSFATLLIGFALLGIGNTIVQVSANPLLVLVVPNNRVSSYLSFSQFVKAIGSMLGAPLAAIMAVKYGDWKSLFLLFGLISLIATLWLGLTKIDEEKNADTNDVSIKSAFSLLSNKFILFMVLSIFLVVGIDVGFNSYSGQYFIHKLGLNQTVAESARSVYFFGRMIGTFLGAILLTKLSTSKFLKTTAVLSLVSILLLMVIQGQVAALIVTFIIGLAVANIFPLVFSLSIAQYPNKANEISGLMMMAVSGGAIIPFIMGLCSDYMGEISSMLVLIACTLFIIYTSYKTQLKSN